MPSLLCGVLGGTLLLSILSGIICAEEVDLVIEHGLIHDGSGNQPFTGYIAVSNGKIVSVGSDNAPDARWRIDASGLIVAPGFIDLHTHGDAGVIAPQSRACVNYITQGCTTIITGNCGMGPADVGSYYSRIEAGGAGTNVGHLLPQGTLRSEVIGQENRPANAVELDRMRQLTKEAMTQGAWGISTGLIYTPSTYASTEELIELAKVAASAGGLYASHIRGEESGLLDSVREAIRIGRKANVAVHISHLKVKGTAQWGTLKLATALIEEARRQGMAITADQYPYIAASTSLEATIFPPWSRSGGLQTLIKRLDDPETCRRIHAEVQKSLDEKEQGQQIVLASFRPRPDWVGMNLKQLADREKSTPLAIAESVIRQGGASIVNFAMSEEDVRGAMILPWVATASDGGVLLPGATRPHPRSYGTFPRKIGHYSIREQVLPLEQAIRSATGLPADILGLNDRGYVRTGLAADLVLFDPKELIDRATFDEPFRSSSGVRYVFVNGTPALYDGTPTGALAGKALRKQQHSTVPSAPATGKIPPAAP